MSPKCALMTATTVSVMMLLLVGVTLSQRIPRPDVKQWQDNKEDYLDWLLTGCDKSAGESCTEASDHHSEYEGYDGWYNNRARPDLGAAEMPLMRMLPPAYADGVFKPAYRPANPFTVSESTMKGNNGMLSVAGKTAFLVYFGQQVVEEVLDAQRPGCPPEYFNIPVPDDHPYKTDAPKLSEMPLLRSRYDMNTGSSPNNPRQQLNEITPFLDGGLVYGSTKGWADVLRLKSNGMIAPNGLLATHDDLGEGFPAGNNVRLPMANPPAPTNHTDYEKAQETAKINRFFKLGNPRGNENPYLLSFGIILFRWHNTLATKLRKLHPAWTDERLFNEARKWVIATHQSIVMYDWLPKWLLSSTKEYDGYKPAVDPQISHAFQSAAMRFGHTLVTSGVYLRMRAKDNCRTLPYFLDHYKEKQGHIVGVRTCNSYWRSPELFKDEPDNVERFLMGMSSQSTEKEDNIIVDDLRGFVFGPLEFSRRDLMAINIQRGRDHGLPDYNTARAHMGLTKLENLDPEHFRSVTNSLVDIAVLDQLKSVYKYPNQTDIWAGGLMETTHGPGQLFSRIIKDQFERIRDGDRFWFENKNNGQFTRDERKRIRQVRIIDLILSVTDLTLNDIQEDPFVAVHDGNDLPGCKSALNSTTPCELWSGENTTCRYLGALGDFNLEKCTQPETFDYFTGSPGSFIGTFIVTSLLAVGLLFLMWGLRENLRRTHKTKREDPNAIVVPENAILAKERISTTDSRFVAVLFQTAHRRIDVQSLGGSLLRTIDMKDLQDLKVRHLAQYRHLVIRANHHHDLYLKFADDILGHRIKTVMENFCNDCNIELELILVSRFTISRGVTTYKKRAKELEEFSRLVLSQGFENTNKKGIITDNVSTNKSHLFMMQITKAELAAELGTDPDTLFMEQLFRLMDKDQNGFILLKEFWDVMALFDKGEPVEKARLIFNIYDVSREGTIDENDLRTIIQSMVGPQEQQPDIELLISNIYQCVNLKRGQKIDFDAFYELFRSNEGVLRNIHIQQGKKQMRSQRFSIYGYMGMSTKMDPKLDVNSETGKDDQIDMLLQKHDNKQGKTTRQERSWLCSKKQGMTRYLYNHQIYIWWMTLYTIGMLLIFAERAYYYSVEREHSGLRRIAGYGVTVTRGAASAMMFTYSTLLITMCRNILNMIRSSFLHRYFPIDHMVSFHRYIGGWALLWTLVHVIGHAINFYHISTQTPSDLACLFRDYFRGTHVLPKFDHWCWRTVTGLTGIWLTLHCAVIYVFAIFARRFYFKLFWITHNSYPIFYLFIFLHGSGNLVQPPFFHYFFLGPAILFAVDKLISISGNTVRINVIEAQHLPSNVTLLKIRRPLNFSFHAGQWIRIASTAISSQEYHPFTISSAPHEEHLTLHIRAVGPWTTRIRKQYPDMKSLAPGFKYPTVYIEGPFGEGHQTWWDYEVSILVGGGIGVTPFASILKHIAHICGESTFQHKTKRIMFLWVTTSQKQFEWVTEILHEVEKKDKKNIIRNHLFITEFKNKFDLRTIFLYLAERHFQKVSGTSLFTGLKAVTHFSRPPFVEVFRAVKQEYTFASRVGVFTCGSPALSNSVENACQHVNQDNDDVIYKHYFENF